ncbi:sialate O-acetylesterase [Thermophagus sp. OGC60D27]|uniref:sialate O-acetylesterase n=1 Tax=Thermophagus sp. OGC60D27 TaxID=3458415 RepID=UPI004037B6D1
MKTKKSILKFLYFSIGILLLTQCQAPKSNLFLPAIFSDNMVLQQNADAIIWGKATPGTSIEVTTDWGSSASAIVGQDSTWQAKFPVPEAGGPHVLTIQTPDTMVTIQNVMLGEVWLASGQSNMEMPLAGWPPRDTILHSAQVIADSDNPQIRMFTVGKKTSLIPLSDVSGSWEISNPQNAGHFSATAYFFAVKLHKELGVPIGIIHSSWGGTPIESWISNETLSAHEDFKAIATKLKQIIPQEKAYNQWLNSLKQISVKTSDINKEPYKNLDLFDGYCSDPETNTENWKSINLPDVIENSEVGEIDGVFWFRKTFEIPDDWAGKNLVISLGPIDDMDVTYLNGERIGGYETEGQWLVERIYSVPGEKIKSGKAVLAVRVMDIMGGGGINGKSELLTVYPQNKPQNAISLTGEWKYKVVAQLSGKKLYLFDPASDTFENRPERAITLNSHTPTSLYNGMIAPLKPFSLKGSIWYQGETNVGRAKQYLGLMELLINDWRNRFNNENMPFYYVQLAPWNYNDLTGISSASLREAQRRSLQIPNAGMAVTLDIGDLNTIHPANKIAVGERLALWALAKNYDKNLAYTGPLPSEVERTDNKVIITFEHTEGELIIHNNFPNQFEIAGKNGKFVPARVKINGNKIEVSAPGVSSPVNVRYAYRNGAEASLFNASGLPAPSFTTEEEFEK